MGYVRDVPNPAFQQAIPHGMEVFVSLSKVVIFGPFRGTISDLIWGPFRTSFGDHFGPHFEPKTELELHLELEFGFAFEFELEAEFEPEFEL